MVIIIIIIIFLTLSITAQALGIGKRCKNLDEFLRDFTDLTKGKEMYLLSCHEYGESDYA